MSSVTRAPAPGANNTVGANVSPAENHGSNANENVIFDRTPVNDRAVAHRDGVADEGRAAVVDVDDGRILHARVAPDDDRGQVAAQDGAKPNARARPPTRTSPTGVAVCAIKAVGSIQPARSSGLPRCRTGCWAGG